MRKAVSGFTIVELLIVIVVIAILAAISIVAYNGIQTRARATAVVDELQKVEKAMRLLAIEQDRSSWWTDNELTGSSNPSLSSIINATNLKNYLQTVPSSLSGEWTYDSDGDLKSTCGRNHTGGTNLFIRDVSDVNLVTAIDNLIDDGNLDCGKIRHYSDGTQIAYSFSYSQEFN